VVLKLGIRREIDRIMDDMWERRQNQILQPLGIKSDGARKLWNKKTRDKKMNELMNLIEIYLLDNNPRLNKEYFNSWKHLSKQHIRLKGTVDWKREDARNWVNDEIAKGAKKSFVYILWRGRKCLYVGQSIIGGKRFRGHHRSNPWARADRLEIRSPKNVGLLDLLECMSIHLYCPSYNETLVRRQKGRSQCEICKKLGRVKKELKYTFAFK